MKRLRFIGRRTFEATTGLVFLLAISLGMSWLVGDRQVDPQVADAVWNVLKWVLGIPLALGAMFILGLALSAVGAGVLSWFGRDPEW